MRISQKTWLPAVLGLTVVSSLIGFGFSGAVQAQSAATATAPATMGMNTTITSAAGDNLYATMASTSNAMSTVPAMMATGSAATTYPLCSTNSASLTSTTPSASMMPTMSATMSATMAATMAANSSAVMAPSATFNAPAGSVAYLGITAAGVSNCGISVTTLFTDGPAATSNLLAGDVIVAINNIAVSNLSLNVTGTIPTATISANTTALPTTVSPQILFNYIEATFKPGQTVTLTVQRNGQQMDVPVVLGAISSSVLTGTPGIAGTNTKASATP